MRVASSIVLSLVFAAAFTVPAAAQKPASPDTAYVHLGDAATGTGAFVAYPPTKDRAPAVIIGFEWWGLTGHMRAVARRLAREGGYVVIVPDLYHGKVADDPDQAHVLMRGLETDAANHDLDAAMAWLRASPKVKGRIGVMGFCMGGGVALDFGLHNPDLSAVVMFYGHPNTDATALAALKAPVMAHFGQLDDGIPQAKIDAFSDAMKKAGRTLKVFTYPGAGHAFMNDTRPSYNPDAARQAWARTMEFFQKSLRD